MHNMQADHENRQSSHDKKLERVLQYIVAEVNQYAQNQIRHIQRFSKIGIALSVEKNINRLFEMIVEEAMRFCQAEGGTLYIIDKDNQTLEFKVLQNRRMDIRIGGEGDIANKMENVPLFIHGRPNHSNISSHVVHTGKPINLPDIYSLPETEYVKQLDFSGTMAYDRRTGYKTRSVLVVPMMNHEGDIIGILQLINARDEDTGEVIAFSEAYEDIVLSLASQAAVAMTNTLLIQELRALFDSFIKSIATAIDEKSAYTGGHIRRVVKLAMMIADNINKKKTGCYEHVNLTRDQMEELYIASWLHDVGKITTPEYVVDKATKLETIFDRVDLIHTRFQLIEQVVHNKYLNRRLELMASESATPQALEELKVHRDKEIAAVRDDFQFLSTCNNSEEFMTDEKLDRLRCIGLKTYTFNGETIPYLTENELDNLSIRKGTLTEKERKVIEHHAQMTFDITRQLAFPKNLSRVPEYASSHHEKINGSGYPKHLKGEQLSLQARIIAVADIFEALTAKDRPYKKAMALSQALKILGFMKNDNHIDGDIVSLFLDHKIYLKYAREEMNPEQIDMD